MLGAVRVFWPEGWVRTEGFDWALRVPTVEALMFRAKWRGQLPRGLAGGPTVLFDRKPTKPPHKTQGFAQ